MTAATCACGCGQQPRLAPYTHRARGWVKGAPIRFVHGHNALVMKRQMASGEKSACWKGGRRLLYGYVSVRVRPGHQALYRFEHDLIAEKVIGRALPAGAVVHHVDENRAHNGNSNLVVLQSRQDHVELHRKMRVRVFGGNPWTDRICSTCQRPKHRDQFYSERARSSSRCKECSVAYQRQRRQRSVGAV